MAKKEMIIFALAFALLLSVQTVLAYEINYTLNAVEFSDLSIRSMKYEPYPVEPGETFDLWIKVQNFGNSDATDASCTLVTTYPFSIYSGTAEQKFGELGSQEQTILQYKIKVDENAVEGENEFSIKCSENGISWKTEKITISVQTRYATLNIKNVKTDPLMIAPGEKSKLLVTVENMADSSMKDITITLNLDNLDIAPSGEIPQQKLRRINAGAISDIIFNIVALPTAEAGIYKVPISISYTDELGKAYSESSIISIEVGAKPDFYVLADSTTINTAQKTGTVSVRIVNRGIANLRYVDVELLESKDYKILSPSKFYIGEVSSDDYETADFKISAATNKDFVLPLKISYKDASNNVYSEQIDVSFKMLSSSEAGGKGSSWFVPVLLLVIAGYVGYRFYKKRKKK